MKYKHFVYLLLSIVSMMTIFNGCKKEENEPTLPVLITLEANRITNISAYSGAEIIDKGKQEIIRQGICWSTKPNPTLLDFRVKDDTDADAFTLEITGLVPTTTYYIRAYATNNTGTGYGNEIVFQTTGEKPVLSTQPITGKTFQSIECGGNIISDGGDVILSRGICWSENPEPSITDNKTTEDPGLGSFTSHINNLASNTSYYFRAYATNNAGTTYGDVQSFTLWLNVPGDPIQDVDGNTYPTVKIGDQIWMQENLRVTKLQDGTDLRQLNMESNWEDKNSPGYYINVDNESFGYIYNGYALLEPIAPTGYHLPTESDWSQLFDYLGGSQNAGGRMKDSSDKYWSLPNVGADNMSGFTALPNGYVGTDGSSHDRLQDASFMVATFDSSGNPAFTTIEQNSGAISIYGTSSQVSGASIRCVKN